MQVLLSICSLLTDPNPDDPLVPEIAHMYVPTLLCILPLCSFHHILQRFERELVQSVVTTHQTPVVTTHMLNKKLQPCLG